MLQTRFSGDTRLLWGGTSENLGFGKGMNAALAELGARGHTGPVLLINNDARVTTGMHAALHAPLQKTTAPTLVAPRIRQDGGEQGWLHYQRWFALVTPKHLPGSFPFLSGCCLLVQRVDNAQPLFDEEFFMYGEDVELSWRWRKQGGDVLLLDSVWLVHEGSASSGQASKAYESFMVHAHWLLARKLTENASSRLLMRLARLPAMFMRACLRSLRYRSLVPLRALTLLIEPSNSAPQNQTARR
jgi:GT2 family glycosyltransferase